MVFSRNYKILALLMAGVLGLALSLGESDAMATGALNARALTGRVRVIDGDSLKMGATEIRLFGVDAFEYKQTCGRLACGRAALIRMTELTSWQVITCKPRDKDGYGRTVAQCFDSKGRDLARAMVESGYAVAYRRHSQLYVAAEATARKRKAGAWAYPFQSPEDYRHKP
jgi:endonuclease YncB( thermonuclease family)